jgi:hypothetical protein
LELLVGIRRRRRRRRQVGFVVSELRVRVLSKVTVESSICSVVVVMRVVDVM